MIKMYVMQTCPDGEYVEKRVVGNPNFFCFSCSFLYLCCV